ncbi:MAG TPA: hypothetical protein VGD40_01770 [Chryseosolibacter sp.]
MRFTLLTRALIITGLAFIAVPNASAQIVVDNKNVSSDKDITYIQFLYFIEKSTFKPVYVIDYGLIDNQQGAPKRQTIKIDSVQVTNSMSPMYIMNLLSKAGWEYMGDETYVQLPLMEDWYSFTLRRKK